MTHGDPPRIGAYGNAQDGVDALLRRIQLLATRCDELEERSADDAERVAAARELDRLHWQLAAAARRAVEHDSGAAA